MIRNFQKTDTKQVMKIWLNGNEDAHPFIPKDYWKSNYSIVEKQLLQAESLSTKWTEKCTALSVLWKIILQEFLWIKNIVRLE